MPSRWLRSLSPELGALALLAAFAVGSAGASTPTTDAPRLEGRAELTAGHGGLVLLVRPSPTHDRPATEEWDAFLESEGGARFRLGRASAPAVFALPAGRYRLDTVRSASGLRFHGVMPEPDSFEVVAGQVVYAGEWWVRTAFIEGGDGRLHGRVSFPREPLDALARDPQGPLSRYLFWLAPVNEKARPLKPTGARTPRG